MMMKNVKDRILDYLREQAAQGKPQVMTTEIASALNMQRTNVSAILNQLDADGQVDKTKTRPVYYSIPLDVTESDVFDQMCGANDSLANSIQLAKAAILYPTKSLNTLIVGNTGTGKSYLAKLMYEFAKKMRVISLQADFKKINCRHFVNDAAKLSQLLFGKQSEEGGYNVFDQAENSILFIDNIDYLDGVSLQKIISYLETGNYYYHGDATPYRKNVTLIAAIDKSANPDIIQTLISKIPIRIELPDLSEKSYSERFELISEAFMREAVNTKYDIIIEPDVLKALLLVENQMNLKYLFGTIKVGVANAYLRSYDSSTKSIRIVLSDFDKSVNDSLIRCRSHNLELENAIPDSFNYVFSKEQISALKHEDHDFFESLYRKAEEYRKKGFDKKSVDALLTTEINKIIAKYEEYLKRSKINFEQLGKVVDPGIIEIVSGFFEQCSQTLSRLYSTSVVYGLCLHLNAIIKNKRNGKVLSNEKIDEVKTAHPREFEQAQLLLGQIEDRFQRNISVDEVALITMFLLPEQVKENSGYPQLLIAMHGDGTASSLAHVINDLVKANNTYFYDMSLSSDSEKAYLDLKKTILDIDQGQGVIVMYDMGSIKTIVERIDREIDVEIRLLYMPVTLIGVDISRKAAMDKDIDRIYHNVMYQFQTDFGEHYSNKMAIITLCHTGEGGAMEIKRYVQEHYRKDIKIYALSVSDRKALIKEIQKIRKIYTVKAFIGTFDPKLFGIPFIPVSRIFDDKDKDLELLLSTIDKQSEIDFEQMYQYVYEELGIDKEKLKQTLPDFLDSMDEIFGLNTDNKVGLFLHLGVMISRLMNHEWNSMNRHTKSYLKEYKTEMNQIRTSFKKIEKMFQIIIPDDEVANILGIVKKEIIS